MSSKTGYELVANKTSFSAYKINKCEPIGLWHLSRHGQRYPKSEEINLINSVLPRVRDFILTNGSDWLCEKDIELLKSWRPKMKSRDNNNLSPLGRKLMKDLGSRMKARLYKFVSSIRSSNQINVSTTSKVRTKQSAEEYLSGFLSNMRKKVFKKKDDIDYLLRFDDFCKKYLKSVVDNQEMACPEINQFSNSSFFIEETYEKFNRRLNLLEEITNVSSEKVFDAALKACRFEYLMDGSESVWCKFFDNDLLSVVEYEKDIENNCEYGLRNEINKEMTCDLVRNLIENMNQFKHEFEGGNNNRKKVSLLFGHSSTIIPFLTRVGVTREDENFDYDDILQENPDRVFKTSKLDPMNSNIAFILYKCNKGSWNKINNKNYVIRVFHNENLIRIDGCKSEDCNLDDFLEHYSELLNKCVSTSEVCRLD